MTDLEATWSNSRDPRLVVSMPDMLRSFVASCSMPGAPIVAFLLPGQEVRVLEVFETNTIEL